MTATQSEMPTQQVLPPGMDAQALTATIQQLQDAIGAEHVVSEPSELSKYLDMYPLEPSENSAPSLVLYPGSVEDVQAILRIANRTGLPVSPISTGK